MQGITELSAAQVELLIVLAEECAEVQHAIAKILRHGVNEHYPGKPLGPTNVETLEDEIADMHALFSMCAAAKVFDLPRVIQMVPAKIERKANYLYHYQPTPAKDKQQ